MTHCPKCNTKVGVLRLLVATRWSPYKCPGCSARFQRRLLPAALLGGIGGGSGALIASAALSNRSVWIAVIGMITLLAVVAWLDWLLVPFDEVASIETPEPA